MKVRQQHHNNVGTQVSYLGHCPIRLNSRSRNRDLATFLRVMLARRLNKRRIKPWASCGNRNSIRLLSTSAFLTQDVVHTAYFIHIGVGNEMLDTRIQWRQTDSSVIYGLTNARKH